MLLLRKTRPSELRWNSDIIVLPADKGNLTVVINATEYDGKMRSLLVSLTVDEQRAPIP